MSNGILLGGLGGSGVNGINDVLRVKDGYEINRGEFISFDTQTEIIASVNCKEGIIPADVHETSYVFMSKDTIVKAFIEAVDPYSPKDVEEDKIILSITNGDTTKIWKISTKYWVCSPRLFKMSETRFLLSYYAVTDPKIYSIEFVVIDIRSDLSLSMSNTTKVDIAKQGEASDNGSQVDKRDDWLIYFSGDAFKDAFTKNTERYQIKVENSTSFYIWYGYYDRSIYEGYLAKKSNIYCGGDKCAKYTINSNGVLTTNEIVSSPGTGNINFQKRFKNIGRYRYLTNNVDLRPVRTGSLSSEIGYTLKLKIKPWSDDYDIDLGTTWRQSYDYYYKNVKIEEFGAVSSYYIENYKGYHYVLTAHYVDVYENSSNNKYLQFNLICVDSDGEVRKQTTINRPVNVISLVDGYVNPIEEQSCDAGRLIIKKINESFLLLIENSMNGVRACNYHVIDIGFNNRTSILKDRYSMRVSSIGSSVVSAIGEIATDFRTNESNILIERTLTYDDIYSKKTKGGYPSIKGGTGINREFAYCYRISMLDSFDGKKIEFFLKSNNSSLDIVRTPEINCTTTTIVPADSDKNIMGISLQKKVGPATARIKKVPMYSNLDSDGYSYALHQNGIEKLTVLPDDFKAVYDEGIKNKLSGKELCEFINSRYSG